MDAEAVQAKIAERNDLERDIKERRTSMYQWCQTSYGEVFGAWVHVCAIRLFVESILRYGLPPSFQACVMKPQKRSEKKLRGILANTFGQGASSHWSNSDDDKGEETDRHPEQTSVDAEHRGRLMERRRVHLIQLQMMLRTVVTKILETRSVFEIVGFPLDEHIVGLIEQLILRGALHLYAQGLSERNEAEEGLHHLRFRRHFYASDCLLFGEFIKLDHDEEFGDKGISILARR